MSINKRLVTAVSRRKGTSNGWGWQEQGAQGLRGKVVLESGESCSFEKEPGCRQMQPASRENEGSPPTPPATSTSQTKRGQGINLQREIGMPLPQGGRKTRQTFIT